MYARFFLACSDKASRLHASQVAVNFQAKELTIDDLMLSNAPFIHLGLLSFLLLV